MKPLGDQHPRVCSVPPATSSIGTEAIELARTAGLVLDPWEAFVLDQALGQDGKGQWAAFEVGLCCPRQNGKNEILIARELAGLFLLGERLIVHSAHQFSTSLEAFRRLLERIEDTPEFDQQVKRVSRAHGDEGIELKGKQRIRFRTRTKSGGRGFTSDCLVLDEAMELPEMMHGALLPTLSARPRPQVWYTGSAVDQWVHENSVVFARIRERGLAGEDPSLAFFEWSLDVEEPGEVGELADDPEAWAKANPGLGIRISPEHVGHERRSMDGRTFAVERLGVGDWPDTSEAGAQIIAAEAWAACEDARSKPTDPVVFAYDITPDRSAASIAVAGKRKDRRQHIEVIERRRGTRWVPERLAALVKTHKPAAVICDGVGPAASLLGQLAELDIEVITVSAKEHAQACGIFFDGCEAETLRHLGTAELNAAVRGAAKRPLGDAWAWSRKGSSVDISPLVAVTLALWGVVGGVGAKPVPMPMVAMW